jgi:O-antigen/teichoic acid export membrane protein
MFVVLVPVNLLNSLSGFVFVAQRRSHLTLLQDIIPSVIKFIPLFLLAAFFADFGVFASFGLAALAAMVIGIFFLIPTTQNGYRPRPAINKKIIKVMIRFSASNYLATLFAMTGTAILPLIVLNMLGAEQNAYFYICWMISSTVASVPSAIASALFAEGACDEKKLRNHVKRSLKFILVLLIPLIIIVLFFGKWLLLIFGTKYSQNAVPLLQVLTITALPLSVNLVYFTIKRVQKEMKSVVLMTGFTSIITLALSYVLLPRIGLLGAGIGWLGANSAVALCIIIIWLGKKLF